MATDIMIKRAVSLLEYKTSFKRYTANYLLTEESIRAVNGLVENSVDFNKIDMSDLKRVWKLIKNTNNKFIPRGPYKIHTNINLYRLDSLGNMYNIEEDYDWNELQQAVYLSDQEQSLDVADHELIKKLKKLIPDSTVDFSNINTKYVFNDRDTKDTIELSLEDVMKIPLLLNYLRYPDFHGGECYHVKKIPFVLRIMNNEILPESAYVTKVECEKTVDVLRYFNVDKSVINNIINYKNIKMDLANRRIRLEQIPVYLRNEDIVRIAAVIDPSVLFTYNNVTKIMCVTAVIHNYKFIEFVYKFWPNFVDAKMCVGVVRQSLNMSLYIAEEHKSVEYNNYLLYMLRKNLRNIEYIWNPSDEVALFALEQLKNLNYIHNPSEKVCMRAMELDYKNIKFIKNPTTEMYIMAILRCAESYRFMRDTMTGTMTLDISINI